MAGENVTFKDIGLLTQKLLLSSTEKIPISDTQYVTIGQIVKLLFDAVEVSGEFDLAIVDEDGYVLAEFYDGHIKTANFDSDSSIPTISTSVSDDALSNTKVSSPKSVKDYVDSVVGDIDTLLAAL